MIDFEDWYRSLKDAIHWQEVDSNFAYHLMANTKRAYQSNSRYYYQSMLDEVDLTKIYEDCKLLALLKKDHNDEKNIPWGG